MISSATSIEVRYAETDMMGIVHHASYLPWLEIARGNLLKERGISYAKLEESGILLPVVEIKMNYRRPATYDDVVTINSLIKERPFAKIRVDYELLKEDQSIASGYSIHAFMNRLGQPIKAPKFLTDKLAKEFE
ncbi:MAG TPA: acyl-CoA thioesterase [Opitutae bacterium]|nr:acyl-CoA thioester hydrolase [Opitutaceae bacterium]HCR29538.1 acyl-CoA thioesterase [Opitutae bacterium]|tara:strand:- start:18 stop:419 length:402 start_codon:yes stop_codon:yes gene_type:complete